MHLHNFGIYAWDFTSCIPTILVSIPEISPHASPQFWYHVLRFRHLQSLISYGSPRPHHLHPYHFLGLRFLYIESIIFSFLSRHNSGRKILNSISRADCNYYAIRKICHLRRTAHIGEAFCPLTTLFSLYHRRQSNELSFLSDAPCSFSR